MKEKAVSPLVFERFSLYYRCINQMSTDPNKEITDSNELSRILDIDPSLIRRDLSLIGKMGKRGLGYSLTALKTGIDQILGKNKTWNLVIIGIGNLGRAALRYLKNRPSNYNIVRLYDNDPGKVGAVIEGLTVEHFDNYICDGTIDTGVITVPADSAQEVANRLIRCGIRSILNFAPIKLALPEDVLYREIDFLKDLDTLTGMLNSIKSKR